MKQKIFSKGKGWYISASNYKDKEDKCYINLYFPKGTEPQYKDNGRGFSVKDIDIQEMKFGCYKGKAELTIFKYELIEEPAEDPVETENRSFSESVRGTEYEKNFGSSQNVDISPDDLPFF